MDMQDCFHKLTPSSASATEADSSSKFSNSKMDNDNSLMKLKEPSKRKLKTEWSKDWECESNLSGARSTDTGFESEEEGCSGSNYDHDACLLATTLTLSLDPDDHRLPPFSDYFRNGRKGCCGTISGFLQSPKEYSPKTAFEVEPPLELKEGELPEGRFVTTYESISATTSRTLARPSATETVTSQTGQHQQKRKIAPSNSDDADADPNTEDDDVKVDKLKRRRMRFEDSDVVGEEGNDANDRNASLADIIDERKITYTKTTLYDGPGKPRIRKWGKKFPPTFSLPRVESLASNDLRHKLLGSNDESQQTITDKKFRPVIIDGSNVAYEYGESIRRKKHVFVSWGIQVCVDHFIKLGCTEVYVVIPEEKLHDMSIQDGPILHDLNAQGKLLTSWSRQLPSGRWVSSYDDRMILDFATKRNGIVVSNDQFRDLWKENPDWRLVIENRVIGFRFYPGLPNEIRFPTDPFGRHGPSLEFLLKA